MEFFLFILVNAALFIRPSEVVEALQVVPVYNILILLCLAASVGPILALTSNRGPRRELSSLCLLVILVMIVLSNVVRGDQWTARTLAVDFLKTATYYLLLLASLRTPARLRRFLTCLAVFTLVLAGTALLHFHHVVQIPSLTLLERTDEIDPVTGEAVKVVQLIATGIYNDPNDLCSILVVATLIALYRLCNPQGGLARLLWLGPIAVYLYALILTQSRGGLLALLAGLMTLFVARFGWRRAIPLAVVTLPAILLLSGGRQTRISTSEGTAQGRMMLWVDGIRLLSHSPIFGIGAGQYAEELGLVAHNSFVHANVELGLAGGTAFLTLFFLPVRNLQRIGPRHAEIHDPELARMRPFLMAVTTGYAVSMLSISRCYVVPTYMIAGLAASYLRMVTIAPEDAIPRPSVKMAMRLVLINAAFLVLVYLFVRFTGKFG